MCPLDAISSMRWLAVATVGLLGYLMLAESAHGASWRLSPRGLGPVLIGMSPNEAKEASGRSLTPVGLCSKIKNGPSGVALEFDESESLESIVLDRSKVRTTRGVEVGDRTGKIFKVYGSAAKRLSRYNDEVGQGFDVVYNPRSGPYKGYRLAFATYRNRIVLIAAGRPGVERVDEFCA